MARGKKTGGRDFQPGVSGNPKGKPPLPQEIRDFRNAAKEDVIHEFKYLWSLTDYQLEEVAGIKVSIGSDGRETEEKVENDTPALRKAFAKIILKAIKQGNMFEIDKILDRVIGKVKEEHDHNLKLNIHKQIVDLIDETEEKNKEDQSGKETSEEERD
jgi:hypothetical protein